MAKKKYLITGGLGFIGSALANKLDGHVTVLSRSDERKDRLQRKDVKILIKDLNELSKDDVMDVDCIYHCVSTVHNYHVLSDPYIDTDTNIKGTIRLLELYKDALKKPRVIFPSTFFVYGNEYDRTGEPIDENSKTEPLGLYPATKLCAEHIVKLYSRLYNIPYTICRFTNVYGATESFDDPKKAWLNFFIMKAIKGEAANIYHGGNFWRDYIYVDDVVEALMFVEKLSPNDTFLIGYGQPVKFKDLIEYILEHTGNKIKVGVMDPPPFHQAVGIKNFVANTAKINALGWKAKISYQEGLQRIIDAYTSLSI
ncbi:MAG: hypothetical protein A3J62_02470 [Candidatus Buchananbacteria bacterium RIFCSPHIGHO2_02_FULL_38_8]|uniref:NAD-dependent epimerase/dehydratase domain-containing protein n=1 Tax=Candidatus Buchananbacteria bacterium RIFCSPHIGHO2_02_FULL_38_8 TaxID=1797538 RepID=A0A1G1Y4E8_9BACT|nr:MAG: hypothetical protein A3J62_02470 [Candidatus Buchananbacteria bacterium RIFCSPHIGHO2_02_FULL_38_8]